VRGRADNTGRVGCNQIEFAAGCRSENAADCELNIVDPVHSCVESGQLNRLPIQIRCENGFAVNCRKEAQCAASGTEIKHAANGRRIMNLASVAVLSVTLQT